MIASCKAARPQPVQTYRYHCQARASDNLRAGDVSTTPEYFELTPSFIPCCRLSTIVPVSFIAPAKSGMFVDHASLVQLVVGLGAAWIVNLLIAKSNSLRSALKSLG